MSSSIDTLLISLRIPLLITPQNKLFTPYSFKQHSHPTLHTPHNPASIRFVPPKPILPVFYLKTIQEPQIRRFNKNPASSLHPPHPTPSSLCYPKPIRQPPNSEIQQKYQVSLLFVVFILAFSPLNIKKYEEVCIFFLKFRLVLVSGFYVTGFSNPKLSFYSGFHWIR